MTRIGIQGTSSQPGTTYLVGGWMDPIEKGVQYSDYYSARVAAREMAERTQPEPKYPVVLLRLTRVSTFAVCPSKIVETVNEDA